MASLSVGLKLRPCLVKGQKHLFHCWDQRMWVAEPSPMVGGSPGGQCSLMLAVVEDENGQVHEVYPREVRFLDSPMDQYAFGEGELDGQISCFPDEDGQGT